MATSQQHLAQFATTRGADPAGRRTDSNYTSGCAAAYPASNASFHRPTEDESVAGSSVALPSDATASPSSLIPSQHGTDATSRVPAQRPLPAACVVGSAASAFAGDEAPPVPPTMQQCLSALDQVDTGLRYRSQASELEESKANPTPFHSSEVPAVLLSDFGRLLCRHTGYGTAGLGIGLALMQRYIRATEVVRRPALCALTAHRLLLTCIVVGSKVNFDHFLRNSVVAKIVGLHLRELNYLEEALLDALAFRAMPTLHEIAAAPVALILAFRAVSADDCLSDSDGEDSV
jgi:hypothetical protein